MSFALPKELNFHETIPVDRDSHQETQVITPITGNVSYLGANQDTIIFNIPRGEYDSVFDPKSSYLSFRFVNSGTATTRVKGSVDSIIGRVETRHGPTTLEVINNYDGLVQSLMDTCYDVSDRTNFLSLTNGTGNTVPTNTLGVSFTAQNAPQFFPILLLSGVCGTLARSYVPVYDLFMVLTQRQIVLITLIM